MPSAITHALVAEEAAKRLPSRLKTLFDEYPAVCFLGAQGPDPFFFATASKEGQNFGKFLHRSHIYETFCLFVQYLKKLPDDKARVVLAYCLGYVAHHCTDVAFHPFVYRFIEQNKLHQRAHQRIENDWDVYFSRKLRAREVEFYPFPALPPLEDDVKPLWKYVSAELGKIVPHGTLKSALIGFEKYLHILHKHCYRTQRRWARFDKLFRLHALSYFYPARDPMPEVLFGEAFEAAANGDGLPPVHTADELFERAVSTSVYRMLLLADAVGGATLPREQFDRHFLTGEHVTEGMNDKE